MHHAPENIKVQNLRMPYVNQPCTVISLNSKAFLHNVSAIFSITASWSLANALCFYHCFWHMLLPRHLDSPIHGETGHQCLEPSWYKLTSSQRLSSPHFRLDPLLRLLEHIVTLLNAEETSMQTSSSTFHSAPFRYTVLKINFLVRDFQEIYLLCRCLQNPQKSNSMPQSHQTLFTRVLGFLHI